MILPAEGKQKWPTSKFLRQGTKARGVILLNKVTIGYELWRLINGFLPELPQAPTSVAIKS